jgi:hypothetical protein
MLPVSPVHGLQDFWQQESRNTGAAQREGVEGTPKRIERVTGTAILRVASSHCGRAVVWRHHAGMA